MWATFENNMVWQHCARVDSDQVDDILFRVRDLELDDGEIGSCEGEDFGYDENVRRCKVAEVDDPEIIDFCNTLFAEANSVMGVDYDCCTEVIYVEYHADSNVDKCGFYDWHADIEETKYHMTERKISLSIQLSHPNDYEGCELEFQHFVGDSDQRVMGTAIGFPSYFTHSVSPCTKGVRKVLVAWASGPNWR